RVNKSSRTAASFCAFRPTRKKTAPPSASSRNAAWAIAEVAPRGRIRFGAAAPCRSANERPPSSHALPEGGVEARIDEAGEFLPLRIKRLKLLRRHSRVLGRI